MTRHCWSETAAASPARLSNIISSYFNMGYVSSQHQDLSTLANTTLHSYLLRLKIVTFDFRVPIFVSCHLPSKMMLMLTRRKDEECDIWMCSGSRSAQIRHRLTIYLSCWHIVDIWSVNISSHHNMCRVLFVIINEYIYCGMNEGRMGEKEIKYTL